MCEGCIFHHNHLIHKNSAGSEGVEAVSRKEEIERRDTKSKLSLRALSPSSEINSVPPCLCVPFQHKRPY